MIPEIFKTCLYNTLSVGSRTSNKRKGQLFWPHTGSTIAVGCGEADEKVLSVGLGGKDTHRMLRPKDGAETL